MTSREQTLAIVLLGAIALTVGGAAGYMFVWQPLQLQDGAREKLTKEIADLKEQLQVQAQKEKQLESVRVRSLPADEELARRAYPMALGRLAEAAGVPKGYTVTPRVADNSTRNVPEISKGKPVYTRITYDLVFKKVDMWALKDFLEGYYRLGLLQQITSLQIKKDEDPTGKNAGKRNDLTVTLTTEAVLFDGADNRRTLLPIPTAFAAAGGAAIFKGMSNYKGQDAKGLEFGHGFTPVVSVPVLSTNPRDYGLIVRKDPFNGPLPVAPPPSDSEPKPPGEDISAYVMLIGVTRSDDGKAWARIVDTANRLRYQIDATRSGIKVAKEEIISPRRGWQATSDSRGLPPGVMVVSAPGSSTQRTFRVIAVSADGLVVADLQTPPKDTRGGRPAGKQPAPPVATTPGNATAAPAPKYYRWGVGQSLAAIKLLSDDEAKKVVKLAEATGPVADVAAVER